MKLIKNARLYTMAGGEISGGMVIFDEKIIYAGAYPANVPNFRCNAEIPKFKVYFCTKFEKLRSETLEKIENQGFI